MLAESKIWLMALFMLISFVYKAWKKKNKTEKDAQELGESPAETKTSSWGIDDLVSQFEETYGAQKQEEEEWEFEEEPEIVEVAQPIEKQVILKTSEIDENYSEVTDFHHSFKEKEKIRKANRPYSLEEEIHVGSNELSLRDMVISTTIFNRPEY